MESFQNILQSVYKSYHKRSWDHRTLSWERIRLCCLPSFAGCYFHKLRYSNRVSKENWKVWSLYLQLIVSLQLTLVCAGLYLIFDSHDLLNTPLKNMLKLRERTRNCSCAILSNSFTLIPIVLFLSPISYQVSQCPLPRITYWT